MIKFKQKQIKVSKNTGSVLVISLVLLTAITLISITSLQRSSLQTRIVTNVQHTESGFNIANSELEETYLMYRANVTADDLTKAINSFTLDESGKKAFSSISTNSSSSYNEKVKDKSHSIVVSASLLHTGHPPFTSGYSHGGFSTYNFEITAKSNAPGNGRILSSQSQGFEVIGPASI